MNSEIKSLLVSVMALAVAGGFSAYNTNEVYTAQKDITSQADTSDQVFEQLIELHKKLNTLNERMNAQKGTDLSALYDTDLMALHRIYELEKALNKTNLNIQNINNKILIVEAGFNKMTQAVPQEEEMFSLVLLKVDGSYVTDGEYLQSETVYISGKYDGKDTNYDLLFKRAGQLVLKKMELNMPTDGVFSYYFNEGHNQPLGKYTATVVVNGKIDTISFEIN